LTRYKYLASWKDSLPAAGILWDTRIPANNLRKRGHPHPLEGIRRPQWVSATDTLQPSLIYTQEFDQNVIKDIAKKVLQVYDFTIFEVLSSNFTN
jgi:hypothetical protein